MKEVLWKLMKRHLKYSDTEMEDFKKNPTNTVVLEKLDVLANIEIRVEVIQSNGCNTGYKVGDTFYYDGPGNLINNRSSRNNCGFLLGIIPSFIYAVHELIYAGIKPEEVKLRFNRAGCFDVGVANCGWGRVIIEVSVVKKAS